jgi:hypothetical protein
MSKKNAFLRAEIEFAFVVWAQIGSTCATKNTQHGQKKSKTRKKV